MSIGRNINTAASADLNTGFSSTTSRSAGRLVTKDGHANVKRRGIGLASRNSIYHLMLEMSRWRFFAVIFSFFIVANLVFATLYFLIGVDHLGGVQGGTPLENFTEAFFFSAQTFTTVGYGRINPIGFLTSGIAAFEAFIGLLSFAVVTGLFYGRFSRPRAYLKFSEKMLLAPFRDGKALMFRMVPYKNNQLTEVEVKLTLALMIEENGRALNKFYNLDLELARINALVSNWTVVHPINEKSPFFGFSRDDLKHARAEIVVYVRAFDEVFSNTVTARTSYTADEIVFGAKFKMMFEPDKKGAATVLYIDRLNDVEEAVVEF